MRVWAETNFLLEIVLEQEERTACGDLLALATASAIELAIPSIAIVEAEETLHRKHLEFGALAREVRKSLIQIRRSTAVSHDAHDAEKAFQVMSSWIEHRRSTALRDLRKNVLGSAAALPFDAAALRRIGSDPTLGALEFPDAAVLSTVLSDPALGSTPGVFLARDRKAFYDPVIRAALESRDCKVIPTFSDGLEYVRRCVARSTGHGSTEAPSG